MKKKMVSVRKADGTVQKMSYEELCYDLGFIPSTHFVVVTTKHTITWSCGKPGEIIALKAACIRRGYEMHIKLETFH